MMRSLRWPRSQTRFGDVAYGLKKLVAELGKNLTLALHRRPHRPAC